MKTTVVFHSADFDGIFCREIARKFLDEKDVQFIGWNFGDPPIKFEGPGMLYILDLPVDRTLGFDFTDPTSHPPSPDVGVNWVNTVWIDHHKTSIESHPKGIPGYRIDGVAACRLCYQYFTFADGTLNKRPISPHLPEKQDYIDCIVTEPLAVRLAGLYDVWDKRDERVDTFQYGLRADDLTAVTWHHLLEGQNPGLANELVGIILKQGKYAQKYAQYLDSESMRESGFILDWEGVKFLCLNSVARGSLRFQSRDAPDTGHDALMSFGFNGRLWTVSLYHAKHQTEIDLSKIAKKYGGGGHAGACGFTCKKLPFEL